MLDRLTKKDGYFSDGNHLIRFAISLGLSAKGKLTPTMLGQLRREDGARNFDSERQSLNVSNSEQPQIKLNEKKGKPKS